MRMDPDRSDFCQFVDEVRADWWTIMAGSGGLILTIVGVGAGLFSWTPPAWVFFIVGVPCLFGACYRVWLRERKARRVDAARHLEEKAMLEQRRVRENADLVRQYRDLEYRTGRWIAALVTELERHHLQLPERPE
jgi:hypothetical protein